MAIADRVRRHILDLSAYPPGKPIEELERELGIQGAIKLASNESPLGPSRRAIEAAFQAAETLNRYPDGSSFYLREALMERLGVAGDQLVFGTGSSEVLELVMKAFIDPGDEVVYPWPSFAMYPICTQGMGGTKVEVPLQPDFSFDVDALADAVTDKTKLLLLANPNNPTGTSLSEAEVTYLLERVPESVVVVLDEAYGEYARRPDFPRALEHLARRDSLLVLRTFSKIYGLAGLRVGYGIGSAELVGFLERSRHPFNVSSLAQVAARAALADDAHVAKVRDLTHAGLAQLEAGFEKLGLSCTPSDANFVLVDVGCDGAELDRRLQRQGVIARSMKAFGLDRHLRVTAGLPEENERALRAFAAELEVGR